jgi:hypothetical protein
VRARDRDRDTQSLLCVGPTFDGLKLVKAAYEWVLLAPGTVLPAAGMPPAP